MFSEMYLAVDWGTTNRSIYLIEQGKVARSERDARGVKAIAPGCFEAEVAALRRRFGDLPMLLAGMVGSTNGWRIVPYLPAPIGLHDLVTGLSWIDDRTAIIPGISIMTPKHVDVMRGEEVQLLGAVAVGLAPGDSMLCQPGTHCKWVEVRGGCVTHFTTAMTGELFAIVRAHGMLAAQLGATVQPGDAFDAGVAEGAKRDLSASLFGIRAAKLLNLREDTHAASFASGLLIGSDVAVRLANSSHDRIHVLADPALGALYAAAIAYHRREAVVVDSHAAFAAGITFLAELM